MTLLEIVAWLFAAPVYPSRGNGFAGTILVALVVIGLLILIARWVASPAKHRRRNRRR